MFSSQSTYFRLRMMTHNLLNIPQPRGLPLYISEMIFCQSILLKCSVPIRSKPATTDSMHTFYDCMPKSIPFSPLTVIAIKVVNG